MNSIFLFYKTEIQIMSGGIILFGVKNTPGLPHPRLFYFKEDL